MSAPEFAGGGQQQPDFAPPVVPEHASSAPAPIEPSPSGPVPTPPRSGRTGAGVGLLLAATGVVTGGAIGGFWGGLAGLLYAGAVRNTYRAVHRWSAEDPEVKAEAVRSATAAGFGGFLAIVATIQAAARKKPEEEE